MKVLTLEQLEKKKARRMKRYSEHPEKYLEYAKKYKNEHRDEHNRSVRRFMVSDVNKSGLTKSSIRMRSSRILFKTHSKIKGYEIHHCFGYEDENKFIYIPKNLHTQIHRLLRDNKIPADSNHWNAIRDLVNSCEDYTYIRT